MFSSRVPGELEPNRLTVGIRRARAAGRPLIDLTISNPTTANIHYPASILDALSDRAAERYEPHPFGLPCARDAAARDYERRGINVAPDRIVLTSSTSEAYSLLFKLLCEPSGDAVMVPVPSYPLFDHLTRLDGVRPIPYRLEYHGRWAVDFDTLDAGWTDRVRAVLAVGPNNPTGSIVTDVERAGLAVRCVQRDAALIIDEVFADYPLEPVRLKPDATGTSGNPDGTATSATTDVTETSVRTDTARLRWRPASAGPDCLTFRLGGLSKSAGLPQVKLGWIAVSGPDAAVRAALDRLELICDTYLSVSTPVQVAAPRLLEDGAAVRRQILDRVRGNYDALRKLAAAYPSIELLHGDGGWSAVLRVPSTMGEEELVLELLDRDGVLVHPGFFFDFAHEAFLVVSLLPEPAVFLEGIRRVMERAGV